MAILNIKNMVCDRCKKVVKDSLKAAGLEVQTVELGRVEYNDKKGISTEKIRSALKANGFALLDSAEEKLIETVKILLLELVNELPLESKRKISTLISEKMARDYSGVSKVFSKNERITIEKYYIRLKIEKAKELIRNSEFSFSEIAYRLDYANVNHLSRQFKNETGMSMTAFKNSVVQRIGFDKIV